MTQLLFLWLEVDHLSRREQKKEFNELLCRVGQWESVKVIILKVPNLEGLFLRSYYPSRLKTYAPYLTNIKRMIADPGHPDGNSLQNSEFTSLA